MNRNVRRIHAPAFKAQVALEAIKETKTVAELSSLYKIHATQITKWKHEAIELITGGFSTQHKQRKRHTEALIPELFRQSYLVFQDPACITNRSLLILRDLSS